MAVPRGRGYRSGFGGALLWFATMTYMLLIAYGSLFPFSGWQASGGSPFAFLSDGVGDGYSAPDLFVNLVAYAPLGFLLTCSLATRFRLWVAVPLALALGCGLSMAMEALQSYMPSRVSSVGDLLANTAGAFGGALIALLVSRWSGRQGRLHSLRVAYLREGDHAEIAFLVAALSMFVLLGPLLPSLDSTGRLTSVAPVWRAFLDASQIEPLAVVSYGLQVLGLLALAGLSLRRDSPRVAIALALLALAMFLKFAVAVLYLNVPFHRWIVSGKAFLGIALGAGAFALLLRRTDSTLGRIGCLALLTSYGIAQLSAGVNPGAAGILESETLPMNWVPFSGQMHGSTGIIDIVATTAVFLSLGLLANTVTPIHLRLLVGGLGTAIVFAASLGTEWLQQQVAGRYADATDTVLATLGWICAWFWIPLGDASRRRRPDAGAAPDGLHARVRRPLQWLVPAFFSGAIAIGTIAALSRPVEVPLSSSALPTHPRPADLPPVSLPGFRHSHPRLPAPSAAEIETMRARNSAYLLERARAARNGSGNLEAAIFSAYVSPGSQDLGAIFRALIDLKFHYRGNGTETVALGYDWLYEQWSEPQRRQLRERLVEGFEFTYGVIREQRLSPYNVIFYNSPFQRLLALALALYGDDPRGESAMRVTEYLLRHDVLPVWRQIMGRNGGWHEGGEYVGIGIGQAIYRVPAMWRAATGEDLFRSEPGIRGFLDFLIYRTRPDGTHYRWGDAAFFDKIVPDQWALALEFGDVPAYSLGPGGARPNQPTSWPWGPLGNPALRDVEAVRMMPLSKLMDGTGTVVARSDWTKDATYVTFRAGDNYWSHAHLDQGAFTIFKGGALAIDSGFYGPVYGSDHHMNYTYQTIAHNTLTITDPDDTVESTNKKGEKRRIANDGGQRRVGSGWGVEPAPINIEEWRLKREIYHSGRIEAYYEGDGLTVAVADITPAYTNAFSGAGTFSHRTRRAERVWRIFAYDREDDVIVVQDQVVSTEPKFRKTWLLHALEQPTVTDRTFALQVGGNDGSLAGALTGITLFPHDAVLNVVGGPGFEFFVDGVNYDERGTLSGKMARGKNKEPGSWRIELSPGDSRQDDRFLVVMLPSGKTENPRRGVTRLEQHERFGCEIVGRDRTTRWWFKPGENAVEIELRSATTNRTIRVDSATAAPPRL